MPDLPLLILLLLLLKQHLLVLHHNVAVILFELLLPPLANALHQLGLDDSYNVLEGGFRGEGKFQLGLHLSDEDIGVILDFCLCCIGCGFLLAGRQALIGLLDPLVAVLVLACVYNLAGLEIVAVINEVQ